MVGNLQLNLNLQYLRTREGKEKPEQGKIWGGKTKNQGVCDGGVWEEERKAEQRGPEGTRGGRRQTGKKRTVGGEERGQRLHEGGSGAREWRQESGAGGTNGQQRGGKRAGGSKGEAQGGRKGQSWQGQRALKGRGRDGAEEEAVWYGEFGHHLESHSGLRNAMLHPPQQRKGRGT